MYTGKFITFEGVEGGGKTTQIKLLSQALKKASISTVCTHEPGGTEGAEAIRKLLLTGSVDRWDPLTETLLHFAARREHVEKLVKPSLDQGDWVLSDRFADSTIAYQGFGHELGKDLVKNLYHVTIGGDFHPDVTFVFDLSPEMGLERTKKRLEKEKKKGKKELEDRYERMDINFHRRVRDGFLNIVEWEPERYVLIDSVGSIEHVHYEIISVINARFEVDLEPVK